MLMKQIFGLSVVTVCLSLTGPVFADGFGGSFDSGGTTTVQPPANPAPAQNQDDGFGGSFGSGGGQPAQTQPAQTQPAQNPSQAAGGNDFGGGDFDTDFTAPVPQPETQPEQPQQDNVRPDATPPRIDPQILAFESRDFGVPPTNQLRQGQFHGPTPTSIPGGRVVSTEGLAQALQSGQQILLIDVLGGSYSLPNAYSAPALSSPGRLNDRFQQQAAQWLRQISGGNTQVPIVVFCSDPMCWLSYNSALRVIAVGYSNVYWYRGGLQAWQMAGLQMAPTGY